MEFERRQVLELFESGTWQQRAQRDIQKYRMGDGEIILHDKTGKPIKNAKLQIKQKNHEFRFGANIFMLDELETDEKNAIYKQKFAELFNMATLPFYWRDLEPEQGKTRYDIGSPRIYRRPAPDLCIAFCKEHNIEPREHALAYEQFFPRWLKGMPVEQVKELLEARMREIARRYADDIPTIEVTNEMYWRSGISAIYDEPDFIEWCFKTARKYFPNNKLAINEATIWEETGRASDQYYSYIEANLLRGAPIDAIGMQCHQFYPRPEESWRYKLRYNPEHLYRILDTYALLGKPLQLTETTISAFSDQPEDEEIQAKLLEYMYTLWFSHPAMEQIIYWNLVDGYAHVGDVSYEEVLKTQGDMTRGENVYYGGLLHFDMSEKPAYKKLYDLIHHVWHTEETLCTDEDGAVQFRGFYGDYEIAVEGAQEVHNVSLSTKSDNCYKIVI